MPRQFRQGRSPVHIAARDRTAVGRIVVVRDGGQYQPRLVAAGAVVALRAFHDVPAIVVARLAHGAHVDFFQVGLAHIGDVQQLGRHVEGIAPWVAQAVGPDFRTPACRGKRVARRNGVRLGGAAGVDVQAQQLAQQYIRVLRIAWRVARAAAIARARIQIAVRPKAEQAAIVVAEHGVGNRQDGQRGQGIGHVGVAGRHLPALDDDITGQVGVIQEEIAIAGVLRMEGHRQQTPLAAGGGQGADVEVGRSQQIAILYHADAAGPFEDEQTAVAGRRREEDGHAQAAGHLLQSQGQRRGCRILDAGAGRRPRIDLYLLRDGRGRQGPRALRHAGGVERIGARRQVRQGGACRQCLAVGRRSRDRDGTGHAGRQAADADRQAARGGAGRGVVVATAATGGQQGQAACQQQGQPGPGEAGKEIAHVSLLRERRNGGSIG
ncbi:hypothetical protein D3C87_1146900 [compost metagenome]